MVQKIDWDDKYLLNIPEIDAQHKKLIAVSQDFYDVLTGDPEKYKLNMTKVLQALADYTVYHFSSEEAFLEKFGYPALSSHKVAHDNFISEINSQIKKLENASQDAGGRFYEYVVSWIFTHIAKADQIWANFVRPKLEA